PASLRILGLVATAALVATSSGCSIIDRLFLLNVDGPYSQGHQHGATIYDGEVGDCRDCEEGCPDGRCQVGASKECPGGFCRAPHTGRYGGLAKHRLTAEERAALATSDYGAVTPAGPPTGGVAYPYYTTRGPRDFLAKKPPSTGPY
ncbi:MAG: hypothetical protein FJ284_05920, partial [Planctomycetes bacterium]|nr:hypothetical protein [Planctomycetota bacterium]